jgi:hypothetical protein
MVFRLPRLLMLVPVGYYGYCATIAILPYCYCWKLKRYELLGAGMFVSNLINICSAILHLQHVGTLPVHAHDNWLDWFSGSRPEVSTRLISKSVVGHDPEPVPSTLVQLLCWRSDVTQSDAPRCVARAGGLEGGGPQKPDRPAGDTTECVSSTYWWGSAQGK